LSKEIKAISEKRRCITCGNEYEAQGIEIKGNLNLTERGKKLTTVSPLFGTKYIQGGGRCTRCNAEAYAKAVAADEAIIKDQREKMRQNSGIPPKYTKASFGNFDKSRQPAAFNRCKAYADNYDIIHSEKTSSLLMFSEKSWGTGKTHLASAICNAIIDRWHGEWQGVPHFISEPELFDRIRATYSYSFSDRESKESEFAIVNRCIATPLLVLDDIGKVEVSDLKFVQRTLFTIIDGRYKAGPRPVVMTTNLSIDKLRDHLGGANQASFDRLMEMTQGRFIQMEGKSFRQSKLNDGGKNDHTAN
jgi:DNA replication protein DnaC